jgi:hypothetical protein
MAFVVSAVVSVVGAAIGTAVGTAVFGSAVLGTIAGVSITAGLIGGVIGAGLAGGLLASARGGSFGQGFLMGAGGAAIGGFLSGAFDGATGAAVGASGDTVNSMLAAQGGADFAPTAFESGSLGGATTAADATSGASTYGLGDVSAPTGTPLDTPATPAPTGGGDLATSAVNGASDGTGFSLSSLTDPNPYTSAAQGASVNPAVPSEFDDFSLQNIGSNSPQATQVPLAQSAYGNPTTSTPTPIGDTNGGAAPAPISNLDNAGAATTPDTGDGADAGGFNSSAHAVNAPDGTTSSSILQNQLPDETLKRGGLAGLYDTAKGAWNDNMPKGSLLKVLGGGADYLQRSYDAHKLDRINKGMKPLTFDEYKQQYAPGQADRYAAASQRMAQSGHTGTLPILMANMNGDVQAGYSRYLPGAQQQYLTNTAAIQNARQGAVKPLFSSIAGLNAGKA